MKGKVNCTCGWSWNKSDSSAKDMYICHECGRDNSNNMKNGGWLDNIPQAQEGEVLYTPPKSQYKRLYGHAKQFGVGENENMRIDPNTGYSYFPQETSLSQEKEVPNSSWNTSRFLFDPFIKNVSQGIHNAKYNNKGEYIDSPGDVMEQGYLTSGMNRRKRYDAAKKDITSYYKEDLKQNDDDVEKNVDDTMDLIRKMRRTEEMMQRQNETYKNFQNPEEVFKRAVGFYGDDEKINPSEAKRAYKMFQKTWKGTSGKEARKNSREELKKAKEALEFSKEQMKEGLLKPIKPDPNYVPEDFANGGILKNGGWLDQYADGGTMQEHQENYNDYKVSAPEGMVGDGFSNVGRNYSPAWGGQFEDGGEIPKAQKGIKKPLYVESKNDPRYKAYQDSLRLYTQGQKQKPIFQPHPEITKEQFEQFEKWENEQPGWNFDEAKYKKDVKNKKFKNFDDYVYDYKKYQTPEDEAFNKTISDTTIVKGNKQYIYTTIDGKIDKDSAYNVIDTETGTAEYRDPDGRLYKISNDKIKPIKSKYTGLKNPVIHDEISTKSLSTGWYDKKTPAPAKTLKSSKSYKNYSHEAEQFDFYKKPEQPILVKPTTTKQTSKPIPYKKRDKLTPIQNNLKPEGVIQSDAKLNADVSSLRPKIKQPEYYDITSQRQNMSGPSDYYNYNKQKMNVDDAVRATEAAETYNKYIEEKYGKEALKNPKAQERLKQLKQNVEIVPQAQKGKKLTFLQPTSDKLPEGYMKGSSIPSTERAMSIGGENGEPAYLIPSFKYGQELLGPVFDPISEFRRTGEHLGGPFKTWQEAEEWENTVRHPAVENRETIMFPQEKFQTGGAIPGSVGFTYARTKGIPSNGPYAKKTLPSAQNGVDMYGNPITAELKYDQSVNRTNYNPRTNQMIFGNDMPYFLSQEQRDKTLAHENRHAWQFANDRTNFNIVHQPEYAFQDRLKKKPEHPSTDEVFNSYHDRKQREVAIDVNKFKASYPELSFMPDELIYKRFVDNQQYDNPLSVEGEAQYYENTGERSFQNGGEMKFYQHGLDFKPKSISRDGAWLNKYEKGGIIKDDRGQWEHPGEITEIGSNQITMQGVPYPVLGISNTGDVQMMYPEEEYEFDGEKVTEYPMAQGGIEVFKKKPFKLKKEQNITVKDKTSVKQNKQDIKPNIPLTKKEIVKNSINNQKRFMKDWMNSPMYDEMVDNSTTGYFDEKYLNSGRNSNFNNTKVQILPQPKNRPNSGATSNSETGLINLYPLGAESSAIDGMLAHEFSHSSDRPTSWSTSWVDKLRPVNKYNTNINDDKEVRLIPEKDINLMKSFYSDNNVYKKLFNKSALKNEDLNEDREWFNYVSEPTETRARLNDIRYNAKKYNVYDPFTEKVTPEILNKIKKLTKKAKGFDPFNQLQNIYSDEEILNLLNTVSQNEQPNENSNIAIAKNGRRQEQKGLVNLDDLTNFTNYNKQQPDGWLNKYAEGGVLSSTPSNPEEYDIKEGDTLFEIARDKNIPLTTLANANNLTNPDLIKTGNKLVVPKQYKKELTFNQIPTTDNKKVVIDNFSKHYDYIVEGDKTYYKVKSGNTWADISDNKQARTNLLNFLDKNDYWAGYGSGEKAKYDKVHHQPLIIPGGKVPKTTPSVLKNTETNTKPTIVKRPIQKVVKEESSFFDDISDMVSSGVESLGNKWTDVKKEVKNIAKDVESTVSSGINNAISTTEDAYHTILNGVQRKFKTHTGEDDDIKVNTTVNPNPKTVKEWYGNKTGAEITNVIDAPNVPGRTYKQQVLPASNIKFGVRNRGEYKDIKTDGLEITTFNPFTKDKLPDETSVLAIDAKGNLHTGQYKDFKNQKDFMFSKTFRNKIIDFSEVNGKGEYISGAKSGNPKYQQPKIKVLDDNGKVVNGSLNILVKDDSKKDYYGQVQGGRILFVNPTTKEQYLVSGSMNHIKQKFKELKGNNKYLEAYTLDNGTYSRGLSYKDKKLTKDRLKSYDLENTGGGNGLYIIDYKQPVNKYEEDYIDNMPNVRTKNDTSYKKGHPLKNEIKNIVLHHTAYMGPNSEKEVTKQYMTPGQNSSHIVIQENGKRSVYASPEQVTFHAGESEWNKRKDVNDFSIGVEFQGDTNKKPLTQAQVESFVEYYAPLAKKYNLSLKDIITHQMVAPGRKPDISEKEYARILKYMASKNFK